MVDLSALTEKSISDKNLLEAEAQTPISAALKAAREHLGMEVAYVSEFVGDKSIFRSVDAPGKEGLAKVGDEHAIDDIYCKHILEGRLPQLIPDTSQEEIARALPITAAVPIGSHLSVPIRLSSGEVYGMFCCLSSSADPSLTERDLGVMRAFADIAAQQIDTDQKSASAREATRAKIQETIDTSAFAPVFQPIWDFSKGKILGFESLTRFSAEPSRPPNVWFDEAEKAGLGVELELAAARAAIKASRDIREHAYLTLNFSPAAIISLGFKKLLTGVDLSGFVLEITEHAPITDMPALTEAIARVRNMGMRLAVDDAGAGHSGLQRIIELSPDIIKLDMSLTRDLDMKPALRALASALIYFSRETGSLIIAEGVERQEELDALRLLGINRGQGYLLGRPVSAELALDLLSRDRALESILRLRLA